MPNGALGWQSVAAAYQEDSKEVEPRNPDDIKRHWHTTLCNKLMKPTGRSGGNTDRILRCIRIQGEIMKKTDSVIMGIESDEDANFVYGEDEEDDEEEEDGKISDLCVVWYALWDLSSQILAQRQVSL